MAMSTSRCFRSLSKTQNYEHTCDLTQIREECNKCGLPKMDAQSDSFRLD